MTRYVIRRLGLAVVTLFILSVVVFVVASVLPGSVGRAILGPFALQESVDQINKELGVNGSLYRQYFRWISRAILGDFGDSYKFQGPVIDYLASAFGSSAKLAFLTLIIVVPIGVLGGAIAALRKDQASDRIITVTGLSLAVTPEFAIGIVLILFFAVKLRWVPAGGSADGSVIEQFKVLILPAVTLSATLFGYIARMTRAGTIEALAADYTRTAELKGLSRSRVLGVHVLRNALLPTIAVLASQMSYLLGGLLVTETMFNYKGLGLLIANAANDRDIPMLMAAVFVVGAFAMIMTLIADVITAWLNPRIRFGSHV